MTEQNATPNTPDPEAQAPVGISSASDVAPGGPPPASDVDPAGADVPPAGLPPDSEPGAVALEDLANPTHIESAPIDPATPLSDSIDTPAKALELLGEASGIPAGTTDAVRPLDAPPPEVVAAPGIENTDYEHPYATLQRLRTKLTAYGQECYDAVKPEVEHLMRLFED